MISIIVPIYNVEKYLSKCLDSIINQTYKDLEIILVNDGSLDDSRKIMERYQEIDNRIICLDKENGGLSDARNYGIKRATGDFCLLIDSDDYIALDTVELCVENQKQNDSDIVVFDMEYVYENERKFSSGGEFKITSFKENKDILMINNSACNKMFKTELLRTFEFPKGMLYEDLATIPVLMSRANKISKVDKVLYYYVQRSSSIVHDVDERIFDIYKAIGRIKNNIREKVNDDYFNELYIKHGLFLTTLRIKDCSNVDEYLRKNVEQLDIYYPSWRKIKLFKNYNIKQNIVFKLLQNNKFELVKKIYGR